MFPEYEYVWFLFLRKHEAEVYTVGSLFI